MKHTAFTRPAPGIHRIHVIAELEAHQAQVLATIAREVTGDVQAERTKHIPSPAELRGIPAIGRNVTGAIHQTKPGWNLDQLAS
jgi:hypothetical protein